jgi:hypothetical protein
MMVDSVEGSGRNAELGSAMMVDEMAESVGKLSAIVVSMIVGLSWAAAAPYARSVKGRNLYIAVVDINEFGMRGISQAIRKMIDMICTRPLVEYIGFRSGFAAPGCVFYDFMPAQGYCS